MSVAVKVIFKVGADEVVLARTGRGNRVSYWPWAYDRRHESPWHIDRVLGRWRLVRDHSVSAPARKDYFADVADALEVVLTDPTMDRIRWVG